MSSWTSFLAMCGSLLFFAGLVIFGGWQDERRYKRQRAAEEAAQRTAAE